MTEVRGVLNADPITVKQRLDERDEYVLDGTRSGAYGYEHRDGLLELEVDTESDIVRVEGNGESDSVMEEIENLIPRHDYQSSLVGQSGSMHMS